MTAGHSGDQRGTRPGAQAAPADLAEFQGNVKVVKTDALWDTEADAVFKKGWKANLEEWHYLPTNIQGCP